MKDMTLIVDAGGTKTDWILAGGGGISKCRTAGINPAVMPKEEILAVVLGAAESISGNRKEDRTGSETCGIAVGDRDNPEAGRTVIQDTGECAGGTDYGNGYGDGRPCIVGRIRDIRYYGAGVVGTAGLVELDVILKNVFHGAEVSYGSDLLLAAEAGLDGEAGIVGILGTGSNSGVYDGRKIVANIRPGGFVLGDEGSGNAMGRILLGDYIKDRLPAGLKEKFEAEYRLTYAEIVENVYRRANPAGYLASFAPFIFACRGDEYADALIDRCLRSFIERSLLPYGMSGSKVAITGSVGMECKDELRMLGQEYDLDFFRFVKSPADELIGKIL